MLKSQSLKASLAGLMTAMPLIGSAKTSDELLRAWQAAFVPSQTQGNVMLRDEVSVEDCMLGYTFVSNEGTVTDTFILPLANLDMEQSRLASDTPTVSGIVLILDAGAVGETTKTLANGRTLTRDTTYGPLFSESFVSDALGFELLDAVEAVSDACRGSS